MSLTCSTSQPVAIDGQVGAHPLHLVVVGAADQVDELGVGAAQHGPAVDQPALVEGPAERQRARLRDDRLVEVEERGGPGRDAQRASGAGRGRPRIEHRDGKIRRDAGARTFASRGAVGYILVLVLRCDGAPTRPAHPPRVGPQTAPALPPGGGRRMSRSGPYAAARRSRGRPQMRRRRVRSRAALIGSRATVSHPTSEVAVPARPLLVTGDPDLLDDLLRLAAAAGVETEVAHDVVAARGSWAAAPLVLVGADAVGELARGGLPRRPGVLVVPTDLADSTVWELAASAGAESVQPLPGAEALLVDRLAACRRRPGARHDGRRRRRSRRRRRLDAGRAPWPASRRDTAATVLLVDADPLRRRARPADGCRGPARAALARPRRRPRPGQPGRPAAPRCPGPTASRCCPGTAASRSSCRRRRWTWCSAAGRRGHDLVVVDLPRSPDPAAEDGGGGRRHGAARRAGRGPCGGGGGPAWRPGWPAGRRPAGRRPRPVAGPADRPAGRRRARPAAGRLAGPGARAGRRAGARRAARARPGADRWRRLCPDLLAGPRRQPRAGWHDRTDAGAGRPGSPTARAGR